MADEPNPTPVNNEPPKADPPLPNDPAARNPDGSLKDSSTTQPPKDVPKADDKPPVDDKKPEPKADDKKPDDKKPDEKPLVGAPEKYEAFKAPEGFEFDVAKMEELSGKFKAMNLSQEGAQQLIDFHTKELLEAIEAPYNEFVETRKGWREEMSKDKEIGNGTDDLKPEVKSGLNAVIAALPEKLQTPFKEAMVLTGAGDNPAFVKAFYHLSKPYVEGKLVTGSGPSPAGQDKSGQAAQSGASVMYPHLPSESSPRAG